MREWLLWLVPLFFLIPVLVGILDVYAQFILGAGFLDNANGDVFVLRVLTLWFSGFLGVMSLAFIWPDKG